MLLTVTHRTVVIEETNLHNRSSQFFVIPRSIVREIYLFVCFFVCFLFFSHLPSQYILVRGYIVRYMYVRFDCQQ